MHNNQIGQYDFTIGRLPRGPRNQITDVPGVKVGHKTIQKGAAQTGVTVILPVEDNIFTNKVIGATHIINGFGKTAGSIQINELGTIETPIALTNTLNVGTCWEAIARYSLEHNHAIGESTGTVNPVIGECNDMFVNDIRQLSVSEEDVFQAIEEASEDFLEGSVGAGTGMKAFGLKGGIGSSSRMITYPHGTYMIGACVLANFGIMDHLRFNGKLIGPQIKTSIHEKVNNTENGSIIIVVATDLPVDSRQLKRIISRASVGLARTGAYFGNGSGDIVIGFSTANRIPHESKQLLSLKTIHDDTIDHAFEAVGDATEEAILHAMLHSPTVTDRKGNKLYSLQAFTHLF